jgi:cation diffusion facilitator family transporter
MRDAATLGHGHTFDTDRPVEGERRTRWVVAITVVMMVAEIVAGTVFRSMALLADGWHMGTHAAALGVAVFAYVYARRHAADPRYSFGTGKVGALAGFASAVGLAVVALLVGGESVSRLSSPVSIQFDDAIAVAFIGLAVNLVCAWLLRGGEHGHGHGHAHPGHGGDDGPGPDHGHGDDHHDDHDAHHGHGHGPREHHDHNLRAAYLHVLADALTSVFAILALTAGKLLGWTWMDPVMGLVGAVVIARWSVGLLRDTSAVLLDAELAPARREAIRAALEAPGDRVTDLHVWRVGPRHHAAIVVVVTQGDGSPALVRARLQAFPELAHVTVEIQRAGDLPAGSRETGPGAGRG